MSTDIAVIGLGAMGAALAAAQLTAGYSVTVWNRSPAKAQPLVEMGAALAETATDAVMSSPVTLVCVDTYASAGAALQDGMKPGALDRRTIVQLGTASPAEARNFGERAQSAGAFALDGAIMFYPDHVGPQGADPLLIGGDPEGFAAAEPHLRQISGNIVEMGENLGAAAAIDLGLLTTSVALYAGVAHAAHLCEAEGADVGLLAKLCHHGPRAPERFEIIDKGAFALNSLYDGGSLAVWADVVDNLRKQADMAGINAELPEFLSGIYRRAVDEGHGCEDVAALIKSLRGQHEG